MAINEAVFVTFFIIVFVFFLVMSLFVDKLFIRITLSSHLFPDVSGTLFKYLLLPQIHVLGFQV